MKDETKRSLDLSDENILKELREAAEVHRQVRADAQRFIKPGMKMLDIVK